jgi:hypothetical protein
MGIIWKKQGGVHSSISRENWRIKNLEGISWWIKIILGKKRLEKI